jgi:predicted lipoprotein with Yx(FWY)xxD motif
MRPFIRPQRLVLALVAVGIVAGACGSGSDTPAAGPDPTSLQPEVTAPAGASVKLGQAKLGPVLVGPDGRTLYGFTNDTEAKSTCTGACALAWPPATVDQSWSAGPGLDTGIFATTVRDDGALQLVAGKWPLYYFEGDATAGDTNGQGSGDVWFAVAPDAKLIKEGGATTPGYGRVPEPAAVQAPAAKATLSLVDSSFGKVVADTDGRALYAFTKDESGTPTCIGTCATAWPAASAPAKPTAGDGIDGSKLSVVARPDGAAEQLKLGKWPLYYFAGDGGPGDFNGQASGGVWFLVKGDGTLAKSAA